VNDELERSWKEVIRA